MNPKRVVAPSRRSAVFFVISPRIQTIVASTVPASIYTMAPVDPSITSPERRRARHPETGRATREVRARVPAFRSFARPVLPDRIAQRRAMLMITKNTAQRTAGLPRMRSRPPAIPPSVDVEVMLSMVVPVAEVPSPAEAATSPALLPASVAVKSQSRLPSASVYIRHLPG